MFTACELTDREMLQVNMPKRLLKVAIYRQNESPLLLPLNLSPSLHLPISLTPISFLSFSPLDAHSDLDASWDTLMVHMLIN